MRLPALAVLCGMILSLTGCQSSLRVAEATIGALRIELERDERALRPPAAADTTTIVGSSIVQPAGSLPPSRWPEPMMARGMPTPLMPTAGGGAGAAMQAAIASAQAGQVYSGRACQPGPQASPIDLANALSGPLPQLTTHYRPVDFSHTMTHGKKQVELAPGSWVDLGGMRYELVGLDWRAPAEHPLNGEFAAMELRLVHENMHGQIAILAVMIQPGGQTPALSNLGRAIAAGMSGKLDVMALLPPSVARISYSGSLTAPPCTTGVSWQILTTPISATSADIAAFTAAMPADQRRPLQAANGRRLVFDAGTATP